MDHNPFDPPRADVTGAGASRGSPWKGVVIGGAVDLFGTLLIGILVFLAFVLLNGSPEMSSEEAGELTERYTQSVTAFDSVWGVASHVAGLACSMLGGWVCARFARERWQPAALVLAAAMAVFGFSLAYASYPLQANLSINLLTAVAIYLGAWLREGRKDDTLTMPGTGRRNF